VLRYGQPRFLIGDRALLDLPQTAFLASRGDKNEATILARWPKRPECVISGFLSPMERAMFDACLARDVPMVQVLARGLPARFPSRVRHAIDTGRLLVMTPFDETVRRFSAAHAAWCNQYVLHLATDVVIGRLTQDGMLACLLADMRGDKPITFPPEPGDRRGE